MATIREVLEFVIKADGSVASRQFNDLGDSVDKVGRKVNPATAAMQRFGLSGGASAALVAGGMATAAAAVGAFALKGINDFRNVAIAAGELADKTGLAVEDASRWNEVASDIGISTETLATAFGQLEKRIGANPAKFAALGITAKDANEQMLQAIEVLRAMPEGAERAALGAELFGRSWQNMAELIEMGAGNVRAQLEAVGEAQVIDADELRKAREYRAGMDQLGDAINAVGLAIGESLVPGLAKAAVALAKILDSGPVKAALEVIGTAADAAGESLGNLTDWDGTSWADQFTGSVSNLTDTLKALNGESIAAFEAAAKAANPDVDLGPWEEQKAAALGVRDGLNYAARAAWEMDQASRAAAGGVKESGDAAETAEEQAKGYAEAVERIAKAEQDRLEAYLTLPDAIDDQAEAFGAMVEAVSAFNKEPTAEKFAAIEKNAAKLAEADARLAEAQAKSTGEAWSQVESLDATNLSYLKQAQTLRGPAKQAILDRIAQINGIPDEQITEISAALDRGDLATAEALLNNASRARRAAVTAEAYTADAEAAIARLTRSRVVGVRVVASGDATPGGRGGYASGGQVQAGMPITVGDRGREVFIPDTPGIIVPNHQLPNLGGSGAGTINVYMPAGSDGADVVNALERYAQRNGRKRLQKLVA